MGSWAFSPAAHAVLHPNAVWGRRRALQAATLFNSDSGLKCKPAKAGPNCHPRRTESLDLQAGPGMATWFGSCFGGLLSTRRSPPPPASPPAALLQAVAPRKAPLTPRVCAAAAANGNSNGNSSSSVTAAPPQQQRAPQPGAAPPLLTHWLPIAVLTDSYKTTHFVQYPDARKMVAVSCQQGRARCAAFS